MELLSKAKSSTSNKHIPGMDRLPAFKSGSAAIRLFEWLQSTVGKWTASSVTVSAVRSLRVGELDDNGAVEGSGAVGVDAAVDEAATEGGSTVDEEGTIENGADTAVDSVASGERGGSSASTVAALESETARSAVVVRLFRRLGRFVETSWLYRWLTAEPEADVIVIDLRETLSVGPLLAWVDDRLRTFVAVMPTAGSLRGGFRLRGRFVRRPLGVLSLGVLVSGLVALAVQAVSGTELGLSTMLLFAVLLLAARGTQSTRSLAELTETSWYEWLSRGRLLFEPPEPPTTAHSRPVDDSVDDAAAETETATETEAETDSVSASKRV